MKHALLSLPAIAGFLLLSVAPTRGDIEWQPTYAGALKLAAEKNRVVFVAVNMDGERANDQLAKTTYHEDTVVELSARTVSVVGSIFDHKSGKRPCTRFGAVTCTEHREVEAALRDVLIEEGDETISPQHFFLKPDGEVILSVPYAVTEAELEWCFVTAIQKLDPKFEWKFSAKARPPARLVMEGYEPEKDNKSGRATEAPAGPPTREETLHLLDQLKRNTISGGDRSRAIKRIVQADEKEAIGFMQDLLRRGVGKAKDNRPALIRDIGIHSPPSYWELMEDYVDGHDEAVRREAIVALEQLAAPASVKTLRNTLSKERDPSYEKDLVRALASAGPTDKRVRKMVVKLATKDKDLIVRIGAIIGLGHLQPAEDVNKVLLATLQDDAVEARIAAVCAMGLSREASWKKVLEGYREGARGGDLQAAIEGSLKVLDGGELSSIAEPLMKVAGDELRRERFFGKSPM